MQEVMVHQELLHLNIANLDNALLKNGNLDIVMEYADRGELAQVMLLKGGGLTEEAAWDVFSQVCLGIHHVHSKGIVLLSVRNVCTLC